MALTPAGNPGLIYPDNPTPFSWLGRRASEEITDHPILASTPLFFSALLPVEISLDWLIKTQKPLFYPMGGLPWSVHGSAIGQVAGEGGPEDGLCYGVLLHPGPAIGATSTRLHLAGYSG